MTALHILWVSNSLLTPIDFWKWSLFRNGGLSSLLELVLKHHLGRPTVLTLFRCCFNYCYWLLRLLRRVYLVYFLLGEAGVHFGTCTAHGHRQLFGLSWFLFSLLNRLICLFKLTSQRWRCLFRSLSTFYIKGFEMRILFGLLLTISFPCISLAISHSWISIFFPNHRISACISSSGVYGLISCLWICGSIFELIWLNCFVH